MFVCLITPHKHLDRLPKIQIEEFGRTTGMFLALFKDSKLSKLTFITRLNHRNAFSLV